MSVYPDQQYGLFPSIKKLPIDWKVFLTSVCSGLLCHAYCMFNLVENEDTITPYTQSSTNFLSTFQGADTGRWFAGGANWLQGWYRTSVVSGVLIILILAFLAQIFIRMFRIRTAAGAYLCAVFLEVSSPAQAYMSLHEVGYPLSALLAVLGVYFMRRGYAPDRAGKPGKGGIAQQNEHSGSESRKNFSSIQADARNSNGRGDNGNSLPKRKGLRNWIFAFLCESISFVILPVNISCAAVVILMFLILDTGRPERFRGRCGRQWRWTLQCLLVLACSGVFLLISSRVIQAHYGVTSTGYQGAEQAMSGSFLSSLPANYLHAFVKLFIIGVWKIQTMPVLRFAYYFCYLLDIFCVIRLLYKCRREAADSEPRRVKQKGIGGRSRNRTGDTAGNPPREGASGNGEKRGEAKRDISLRILHLILYLFLLPAAVCAISLLSYGFMYRGQHRMAFILFVCGTIPLVEMVIRVSAVDSEESVKGKSSFIPASGKAVYYGMSIAFCLMIYAGFMFDNIGYVNQHHVMMQDQTLCTRILTKLDGTEGFSYDQPVYFLNILSEDEDEAVTPMKLDPELDSVIWPVSTTNLYAYGDSSLRFHMESYEGVVFERPDEKTIRRIENSGLREMYEAMKPYAFHIEKDGDCWVIVVKTVMPESVKYG